MAADGRHAIGDKPRERTDYLLAALAVAAAVLYVFRTNIGHQLSRLHVPGGTSYGYADLHGSNLDAAFAAWSDGKEQLQQFDPVEVRTLVLQRSAVAAVFVVVLAIVILAVVRRLDRRGWPNAFIALFVTGSGLILLIDLSLVEV